MSYLENLPCEIIDNILDGNIIMMNVLKRSNKEFRHITIEKSYLNKYLVFKSKQGYSGKHDNTCSRAIPLMRLCDKCINTGIKIWYSYIPDPMWVLTIPSIDDIQFEFVPNTFTTILMIKDTIHKQNMWCHSIIKYSINNEITWNTFSEEQSFQTIY